MQNIMKYIESIMYLHCIIGNCIFMKTKKKHPGNLSFYVVYSIFLYLNQIDTSFYVFVII